MKIIANNDYTAVNMNEVINAFNSYLTLLLLRSLGLIVI